MMNKTTNDFSTTTESSDALAATEARIAELEKQLAAAQRAAQPAPFALTRVGDKDEQVPGLNYATTYADLARITRDALFSRWLGDRSEAGITAKQAFMGAREIPQAIAYAVEKPISDQIEASQAASSLQDDLFRLVGAAHYLREQPAAEAQYHSRVIAEVVQRLMIATPPAGNSVVPPQANRTR